MKLFGVYDEIGESFVSVFLAANVPDAMRACRVGFSGKKPETLDGLILCVPVVEEELETLLVGRNLGPIVTILGLLKEG